MMYGVAQCMGGPFDGGTHRLPRSLRMGDVDVFSAPVGGHSHAVYRYDYETGTYIYIRTLRCSNGLEVGIQLDQLGIKHS